MKKLLVVLSLALLLVAPHATRAQQDTTQVADSVELANLARFSDMIVDSVNNGYTRIVTSMLDKDAFFQEIWSQIDSNSIRSLSLTDVEQIKKGLFSELDKQTIPFPAAGVDNIGLVGNYWSSSGRPHLVFRFVSNEAFNYFDLELLYDSNSFVVADIYVYAASSYFSTIFRHILEGSIKAASTSDTEDLQVQFVNLKKEGRYLEAKETYAKLDTSKQKLNFNLISYISILTQLKQYDDAIAACIDFNNRYPSDIGGYMQLISLYDNQKKYALALAAIDSIDANIGNDPFLNKNRAVLYRKMGDNARFAEYALKAMNELTTYKDMHHTLIDEAIASKNKEAILAILKSYSDHFYVMPDVLKTIQSSLANLKNDPQLKAWVKVATDEYNEWVSKK